MNSYNLLSLDEDQINFSEDLNDSFNNIDSNNLFKNEFDFLLPSNQKDNIFSDEYKKIVLPKFEEENDNDSSNTIYYEINPKNSNNDTFNSTKNNSFSPEISISDNMKNIIFKTVLHQKRGRKEKNVTIGKKYHGSGDFDNIQRKIQVSFINFLINLANDAIKSILGKESKFIFKDVKYIFKKVVNHNYVEKLKKCKYSNIVQMKVSPKNRSYNENSNKETYFKICQISPELKSFFDKNYLYIFQKYFCEVKNNQNIIDFDGLKIKLSKNTKGLMDLLIKNGDRKQIFLDVVKNVYFRELNYLGNEENNNQSLFIISH